MPAQPRAQSDDAPAAGKAAETAAKLSVERLIARGDDLMAQRDVASARLLYELAASQGSAQAAARVGVTYDPWSLKQRGVQGNFADSRMAADWYRTAVSGGYVKATVPLKRLLAKAEPKAQPSKAKPAKPAPIKPETVKSEAVKSEAVKSGTGKQVAASPKGVTGEAARAAAAETPAAKEPAAVVETAKLAEPQPETPGLKLAEPGAFEKPAPGGAFWVQLASLATRAYANKELARIQQAHGDLIGNKNLILKRRVLGDGDKIMFGIQTGPFADRLAARILCAKLKSKQQDCFVVP